MPKEFKQGTWLFTNGDAINLGDFWRKSTKKNTWFLPRIEIVRSPKGKKV
jgi:hypothetical protein